MAAQSVLSGYLNVQLEISQVFDVNIGAKGHTNFARIVLGFCVAWETLIGSVATWDVGFHIALMDGL